MDSNVSPLQEFIRYEAISQSSFTCICSTTRSLELSTQPIQIVQKGKAQLGSAVVCEVLSIGAHQKVENRSGRPVRINPGDRIIGVIGNRQSTISMYGGIPDSGICLPREEPVDLLSSGGLIGECLSSPSYLGSPTKLRILGLASQNGQPLKGVPRYRAKHLEISCPLVLIAGTSATVGKTKFASKLIHFMEKNLGRHVAATKLAGAGNLDDLLSLREHGANPTLDFVDAGLVSTYGSFGDLVVEVAKGVLNQLARSEPDVIIAELGGDILGANVPAILADSEILAATSLMVLVPSDIFAALGALSYLRSKGFRRNIHVAQPIKNAAMSQKRARSLLHSRLFDCEKNEDLNRLVEHIEATKREKENLVNYLADAGTLHPVKTP